MTASTVPPSPAWRNAMNAPIDAPALTTFPWWLRATESTVSRSWISLVAEGGEPAARAVPAEVGGVHGDAVFRKTAGQGDDLLVALRARETVAEHNRDVCVDRAVQLRAECHAVRCGERERFGLPRRRSAAVGHGAVDAASRARSGQRTFVAQPNCSKSRITRADESIWCGAARGAPRTVARGGSCATTHRTTGSRAARSSCCGPSS